MLNTFFVVLHLNSDLVYRTQTYVQREREKSFSAQKSATATGVQQFSGVETRERACACRYESILLLSGCWNVCVRACVSVPSRVVWMFKTPARPFFASCIFSDFLSFERVSLSVCHDFPPFLKTVWQFFNRFFFNCRYRRDAVPASPDEPFLDFEVTEGEDENGDGFCKVAREWKTIGLTRRSAVKVTTCFVILGFVFVSP